MRAIGLIAIGLGCLLGDLAMAASPMGAPINWTGLYIGADGGYAFNQGTLYSSYLPNSASAALDGLTVGGHVGYLFQLPSLVFGIEGDGAWVDGAGGGEGVANSQPFTMDHQWSASVRGTVGKAVGDHLFYLTGGVAFAGLRGCVFAPLCEPTHQFSDVFTGWTAGVGVAKALTERLVIRVQYLHAGFGSHAESTPSDGNGTTIVGLTTNTITAGLGLKF